MDSTQLTVQGPALVIASIIYALVVIGVYVWSSVATAKVFTKFGEAPWKAWVPIVNTVTILQLGAMSPVWVIALFFPVVNIAGLVVFFYAIHAINKRFGVGGGMTVAAVLVYPVWASILGFGSAQPVGVPPLSPVFQDRMTALHSPVPPMPAFVTAAPLPPVAPSPVVTPPESWQPLPPPVQASAPPVFEEVDEKTVLSRRRRPVYILSPVDAPPIALTADVVLLGRNPTAGGSDLDAQLVAIADPSKTMSKTHARLRLVDGGWEITDLNSTNGIVLIGGTGEEVELDAGGTAPLPERFKLGQFELSLGLGA